MICCICQRDRKDGVDYQLTEEERTTIKTLTKEPAPETYFYCAACHAVATDRVQGLQLFKGLLQTNLTRFGVRDATKIADKYYQFMLKQRPTKTRS